LQFEAVSDVPYFNRSGWDCGLSSGRAVALRQRKDEDRWKGDLTGGVAS
jgi:hypothetical protein